MHAPSSPSSAAGYRLSLVALVVVGIVLHLCQLHAPFGFGEGNAGSYFGCVAKGYWQVGWLVTRGAPFMPDAQGGLVPYLHHPPGGFWLSAALGPHEWQMRLTTLIAHVCAMAALVALVRPVLGDGRALLAGATFLVLPVYYVDIAASQWPFTIACGLLLLLAFTRTREAGAPAHWRALVAFAALVGPWMDWHFGFFCLALIPLALPWRGFVRRLLVPAIVSCASLALFLWWRGWAAQAPLWATAGVGLENAEILHGTILTRPPLLDHLRGALRCSGVSLTWPAFVFGVLGLPWLFARAPRLAGALLVAGTLGTALFGFHVQTHTDFPSMLAPAVAVGVAAFGGQARAGLWLGVVVCAAAGVVSLLRVRSSRTTFFADYGAAANAAARATRADGSERRYVVASDATWTYRYYIDEADVLSLPVLDPQLIENTRADVRDRLGKGVRYLSLRYAGVVGDTWPRHPALAAYLDRFPTQSLPQLERSFPVDGVPDALRVRGLLVTIDP